MLWFVAVLLCAELLCCDLCVIPPHHFLSEKVIRNGRFWPYKKRIFRGLSEMTISNNHFLPYKKWPKKWFFCSYRKWPFLTRCFRQHKKWPKADFYGIKSGSERKWYSDKTHFMEWKILSDFIGLGNGNLDEIESSNFKLKRNKCLEDSAYHTVSPQPGFNFWVAKKPRVIPACHFTAGNGDIINRPTFLSLV